MDQYAYLTQLTPHHYKHDLNPAQQMSVILDLACKMGFAYTNHANIRTELFIEEPAGENKREPFFVVYNNAARPTCNNGHLMLNKYIRSVWAEPIEFECGFRKPSNDWYKQRNAERVQLPIQPIEIHQESINTDCSDLNAVKKTLNIWHKIMNYDWDGKLLDGTIKG
jgi:hypothetical protein